MTHLMRMLETVNNFFLGAPH